MSSRHPLQVLVIGGGVAAIEAAAALRDLAGHRVALTIVSDVAEFVYRPLTLLEAFGRARAPRRSIAEIADHLDARFVPGAGRAVDRGGRRLLLDSGEWLRFDEIILAPGAVARPLLPGAITLGLRSDHAALRQLADAAMGGRAPRIAFVASPSGGWPLPLYECALLCASARGVEDPEARLTVITPELRPLEVFGAEASARAQRVLEVEGIDLVCGARAQSAGPTQIDVIADQGVRLGPVIARCTVDFVVTLPRLVGPHLRGLPTAADGFIPIDRHCTVRGAPDVHAAGDATDYPVRHGSLAAQQADVAAAAVAARAGADVAVEPFRPLLEGNLVPGGQIGPIRARLVGGRPLSTSDDRTAMESKISARYLGPLMAATRPRSTADALSDRH